MQCALRRSREYHIALIFALHDQDPDLESDRDRSATLGATKLAPSTTKRNRSSQGEHRFTVVEEAAEHRQAFDANTIRRVHL